MRHTISVLVENKFGVLTRVADECKRQHGDNAVTTSSGQPAIASAAGQPIVLNKRFAHTAKKIECDPKRLSLAIHNLG